MTQAGTIFTDKDGTEFEIETSKKGPHGTFHIATSNDQTAVIRDDGVAKVFDDPGEARKYFKEHTTLSREELADLTNGL